MKRYVAEATVNGKARAYDRVTHDRPHGEETLKLRLLQRATSAEPDVAARKTATLPESSEIVVYGTAWCGDCRHTKRFLDQHQIAYRWIDVDWDRDAMERVIAINHGLRSVPTLVFPDGSTLTEPSNAQLARKLGVRR
jgi:glutaredoxin-like protein